VIGGILENAGVVGFLENANELYDKLDPERESWIAFLSTWWDEYDTREVKVSDLYDLATKGDYLNEVLQGGTGNDSDRARRTRLGKALGNCTDRVYSYWQIKKVGVKHSAAIYRLSVRGEHTA
jgi:hypothetical protein